jgi:integrase
MVCRMSEPAYNLTMEQVEADPTVRRMLERRSLREETRKGYIKGIRFFCQFYRMEPYKVLERFRTLDPDGAIQEFSEFFAWAKDRVASTSCWKWLPGVRAWMVENGIRTVDRVGKEIAREFRRKFGGVTTLLKRDILSKDEIIRVLKVAGLRERAIIAVMASGGLRLNACLNLQLKHFRDKIWDPTLPCYAVEIPETLSKEGEPYLTFISSEVAEYIRNLLLERQKAGEKITGETYVFTAKNKENKPLSDHRFENIWRWLCEQAGLDLRPVPIKGIHKVAGGKAVNRNAVRYNTRIHALRKFFKTACSVSGVDRMASEAFMGHSLTKFGVESLYDFCTTRIDWLRDEYLKALPNLTFLKTLPVIPVRNHEAHEKIQALEAENRALKEELKSLEVRLLKVEAGTERLLKTLALFLGPGVKRLAKEQGLEKEYRKVEKEVKKDYEQ